VRDILGGLWLAAWMGLLALGSFAWMGVPDWTSPEAPYGATLPPPDAGCYREVDRSLSTSRYVCRSVPADWLVGGLLDYAVQWVFTPLWLLLGTILPPFMILLFWPGSWPAVLPPVLSLGLALDFARRRILRKRTVRTAECQAPCPR